MAAWKHYDFASQLSSWRPVEELSRQMQIAYEAGNKPAVADAFLRACAAAVSSPQVVVALALLKHSDNFQVSAAHPDDDREFVSVE
jgi:hypothetical protein